MLADTKVIAEAWDAGGLYEVGHFPGRRWAVWNGRYRDDIRCFVRGDPGIVATVASRIAGSADIFQSGGGLPISGVNFVTCHDGFTLNDLVSYNEKHNLDNGEENRDGIDENMSWNCGVEGETTDPVVDELRERQIKNFAAILLLSRGAPMIMAGDEARRTQGGNNNAYCQDNETSWFDWSLVERHQDLVRFFRLMIVLRKSHPTLHGGRFFTGQATALGLPDISWHGCRLFEPGWTNPESRVLAFTLAESMPASVLHVMLNMDSQDLGFDLPQLGPGAEVWYRAVDTALPSPQDIAEPGAALPAFGTTYMVKSRSVVVLQAKLAGQGQ
jgi:glycogen operon protein